MLSTKDLEELEITFRNVDSITIIKAGICTIIGLYLLYLLIETNFLH
jgi:hypothetical protein